MRRTKFWIALVLALAMTCGCALAERFSGQTAALRTQAVIADADATIEYLAVRAGQTVQAGDVIAKLRTKRVFATQDGTIASVEAEEGDEVSGEVLSVSPESKYTIYCTSDDAYDAVENGLIHGGETLYVSCTKNGTHRAVGTVCMIDGETYRVNTYGGELYIGETVYLYRSEELTKASKVGIGTVVSADVETYETNGTIEHMYVSAGDEVERGQLLYTYTSGDDVCLTADCDGIVTQVCCAQGDAVREDQVVAYIAQTEDIIIGIYVDEDAAANLREGMSAKFCYENDPECTWYDAYILGVSGTLENSTCTVLLTSSVPLDRIGQAVEVVIKS